MDALFKSSNLYLHFFLHSCALVCCFLLNNRQKEFSSRICLRFDIYFHFYFLLSCALLCCLLLNKIDRQSSLRRIPLRFDHPLNCTSTSPVRYVLKIHFFIEFGLKMIQFKIQFITKSKIFIQKKYSFNRVQNIQ